MIANTTPAHNVAELVSELTKAWNSHDAERVSRLFSPEYEGQDISEPGPSRGRLAVRASVQRYLAAFPDLLIVDEQIVVDGNRAAVLWMARGTHLGHWMNIPPTARPFSVRGVSFLTINNNQIERAHHIWDLAALLRCLRLLPDLSDHTGSKG
jgi:steroid delta-isomerase-like uncharacterized protein